MRLAQPLPRKRTTALRRRTLLPPQRMNAAWSSFFGTGGSAKDIAHNTYDDVDNVAAAAFTGASDPDVAEVELAVDDEDLNAPSDLHKKHGFYEALGLPIAGEDDPAEALLNLLQGQHDIKQQVVSFARECMISDRDISPLPTDDFLKQPKHSTWEIQDPVSDVLWDT